MYLDEKHVSTTCTYMSYLRGYACVIKSDIENNKFIFILIAIIYKAYISCSNHRELEDGPRPCRRFCN